MSSRRRLSKHTATGSGEDRRQNHHGLHDLPEHLQQMHRPHPKPEHTSLSASTDASKQKKESTKVHTLKPKPHPSSAAVHHEEDDDGHDSDDEHDKGRKPNKKSGKKGARKLPQEPVEVFVPPPPDKIIKIPGSQHHQHHLVVQHNLRARQLQRAKNPKRTVEAVRTPTRNDLPSRSRDLPL